MKYLLIAVLIFFLGCNNNKNTHKSNVTKITQKSKKNPKKNEKIIYIKDNNLSLKFKNSKLIYPNDKMVLLFEDNSFYSKEQKRILQKLNIRFYEINNSYLKNYFNITIYPTIVVLDKNKTIKFENFTPYEILKEERF